MGASPQAAPLRVVLQCRHRFFRDGLASLLADRDDIVVVAAVVTVDELVASCAAEDVDAVVVTLDDLDDGDVDGLVDVVDTSSCVALCTDHRRAARATKAGLRAVVTAEEGLDGIVRALVTDEPAEDRVKTRTNGQSVLTAREGEVLGLIGEGHTTWEISDQLGISRKTVENHKQRIFLKLDVQNQAHAVAVAVRRGLLDVDFDRSIAEVV